MFDGCQKFEHFSECPAFFAEINEITAAKLAIDRVTKKRHRVIDEFLNGFASTLHHEIGRVEVIGKRDGAQVNLLAACFGEHAFVNESRRAIGCALTSLVAVKQIHDLVLGMPRQHANMLHGKRGTQRSDHVGHAGLMHHDDIGIAFADNGNAGRRHSRLSLIEAKKHFRFVEDGSFLRIEVLRLALAHHASAERDHIAIDIANGKHDAIKEAIASAASSPLDGHVGLDHFLRLEALRAEVRDERARPWSKTKLPLLRHLSAQITPRQIGAGLVDLRATPAHKLGVEEFGRGVAHLF